MTDRKTLSTIHSRLSEAARTDERFVEYPEIIRLAGLGELTGKALSGALGHVLYEVNQYDRSADRERPMLSAIAVSSSSKLPGNGFYDLAREYGKLNRTGESDELEFWLRELRELRAYWQALDTTTFKDVVVEHDVVLEAFQVFDVQYPESNDFDQWLSTDHPYKYAIEYDGKLYPPKHILRVVSGFDSGFSGGDQTNRVFQQLGFMVVDKPEPSAPTEIQERMSYLLTWNPQKSTWENLADDIEGLRMGHRPHLRHSCGNTKRIAVGDRVFLMRLGRDEAIQGIMSSGWVVHGPFEAEHWNADSDQATALYIRYEPDFLLDPYSQPLFDPTDFLTGFDWHPQRSGVTIPSEVAYRLDSRWQQHMQELDQKDSSAGVESESASSYKEGAKRQVSGYRYERDPRAREACLRHYGTDCAVCGLNFGEVYGAVGDGFIHVHHLIPISDRNAEYVIDPVRDLRPVCPNCHAMLHRKSPPYTIFELRRILNDER